MGKTAMGLGLGFREQTDKSVPGYGSGDGYGYGDGYGDGDGSGDGSGYGYGYGSGYGDGSGYGYGSGYGSGYGYGYGDGYGYGSILNEYAELVALATVPPERVRALNQQGAALAFWRATKTGSPTHGGGGGTRKVGDVEQLPGPLPENCGKGALHATIHLDKWDGERTFVVALYPPINVSEDKMWALKREILAEIPNFPKR